VDFQRAVNETTEGKGAQERLDTMYSSRKAELERMKSELEREIEDFEARALILSDSARREAEQKLTEADGYMEKRVTDALCEFAAFNAQLAQYTKAPQVTRTRLYLETMKEVLPALGDTWIVDASVTQLLPMLQGKAQGGAK
jgi:regulator of protease activity HflC (stomatin/prohibitin superfamily)